MKKSERVHFGSKLDPVSCKHTLRKVVLVTRTGRQRVKEKAPFYIFLFVIVLYFARKRTPIVFNHELKFMWRRKLKASAA